jgi:hypothetical protein
MALSDPLEKAAQNGAFRRLPGQSHADIERLHDVVDRLLGEQDGAVQPSRDQNGGDRTIW